MLVVDNQGFVDMRVFAVNGSQRMRLGLATSKTVTPMRIPSAIITGARMLVFTAEPMGSSRAATSEQLYVTPGDTIHLMIPPS
ncbi:MAG TPA: hypothetical protein VJ867_01225 [Gemmatimonadaceae bacterium]|nr:hypothetical protein [Gemmatimonadaceae bacterium]